MLGLLESLASPKRLFICYTSYAAKDISMMSKSTMTGRTPDYLDTHGMHHNLKYSIALIRGPRSAIKQKKLYHETAGLP
jgi:hypothetical protein